MAKKKASVGAIVFGVIAVLGMVGFGYLRARDSRTNLKVMGVYRGEGEPFVLLKHFNAVESRGGRSSSYYTLAAHSLKDGRKLGSVNAYANAQIFGEKDGFLWVNMLPMPSLARVTKSRWIINYEQLRERFPALGARFMVHHYNGPGYVKGFHPESGALLLRAANGKLQRLTTDVKVTPVDGPLSLPTSPCKRPLLYRVHTGAEPECMGKKPHSAGGYAWVGAGGEESPGMFEPERLEDATGHVRRVGKKKLLLVQHYTKPKSNRGASLHVTALDAKLQQAWQVDLASVGHPPSKKRHLDLVAIVGDTVVVGSTTPHPWYSRKAKITVLSVEDGSVVRAFEP